MGLEFHNLRKFNKVKNKNERRKKNRFNNNIVKIEDAILDEIFIIISNILDTIHSNNLDDDEDITFVPNNNSTPNYNKSTSNDDYQNISMNINRNRHVSDNNQNVNNSESETNYINLNGGSQLHPLQNNVRSKSRYNRNNNRSNQSSNYNISNTYQPTRGPGGRMEAPREQVVMGSQALQFASRIAQQMRNRQQQSQPSITPQRQPQTVMTYGQGNRGNVAARPPPVAARPPPVAARPTPVASSVSTSGAANVALAA